MKTRIWVLIGLMGILGIWYALSFTEWIRPEPIQIQAEIRELPKGVRIRRPPPQRPAGTAKGPGEVVRLGDVIRMANAGTNGAPNRGPGPGPNGGPGPDGKPRPLVAARPVDPNMEAGGDVIGAGTAGQFEGLFPVVFALDGNYKLTSIRVIEAEAAPNHKAPQIVWQVNSVSNSAPTKALVYGRIPRGMKLKDPRDQVKQLEPGVTYRLELKAGRFAGSTTFQAKEHPAPEAAAQ